MAFLACARKAAHGQGGSRASIMPISAMAPDGQPLTDMARRVLVSTY
jgi:hypothetical protein